MTIPEFLAKVPEWLNLLSLFMLALTLVATVVARITPTKSDDGYVSKFHAFVIKVISWSPTIGTNPQAKALEETIKSLEAQIAAAPVVPEEPSKLDTPRGA